MCSKCEQMFLLFDFVSIGCIRHMQGNQFISVICLFVYKCSMFLVVYLCCGGAYILGIGEVKKRCRTIPS